jgi:hypothetical protein
MAAARSRRLKRSSSSSRKPSAGAEDVTVKAGVSSTRRAMARSRNVRTHTAHLCCMDSSGAPPAFFSSFLATTATTNVSCG